MNIEFWTLVVQAIITIATGGFVVKILRQQITSQQEQINSMKSNIDSMKSFVEIFDTKKLKEYVSVAEETNKMKAEMEMFRQMSEYVYPEFQKFNEQIWNLKDEHHKEVMKHLETEIELRKKYNELFQLANAISIFIPKEHRAETLKKMFPQNAEKIIEIIDSYKPEEIALLENKMQTLLNNAVHQQSLNQPKQ